MGSNLAVLHASSVTLAKVFTLTEVQFLHLKSGEIENEFDIEIMERNSGGLENRVQGVGSQNGGYGGRLGLDLWPCKPVWFGLYPGTI